MEKKLMRTVNENGGLGSKNTILLSKQILQIMNYWWDKCHLYCPFKGSCLV